ncbi:protein claret segregational [Venturia canescens]|uniref:protein claret segregational n=1 Tax=Venturia canescens TaxID=32260 RepID=UPI001C9CAC88|nr:protein claret segregational [Venturia canescens]XP_043268761.1 protein claret segregational [Venturia canescens]
MESRLPKPKVQIGKKANETTEINSDTSTMSSLSNTLGRPLPTVSNTGPKVISKSKSTLNLHMKSSNENKPPAKPVLVRSQTSVAIARNGPAKAVKRLGAGTSAIETKRANLRSTIKTTVAQRPGKVGGQGTVGAGKATGAAAGGVKTGPKPGKWDFKGRLDLANVELANLKEQHKQCSHLESQVNELRSKEASMITKLEELGNEKNKLKEELETTKENYTEMLRVQESIKSKLQETETSFNRLAELLSQSEKVCESQKQIITANTEKVENLEKDLKEYKQAKIELSEKVKNLQSLVHEMDRDRRYLHNAIQELKGNIRVFCRVRPRIPKESAKMLCSINFLDESTMEIARAEYSDSSISGSKNRGSKQEFSFDKVFPPTATQAQVFEELSMLVQSALEGYNVCVFAYGQTGSGKTFTMEGGESTETEGMIPRTVRHIFEEMKQFELLGWEYKIEASFLEIYNEHIVDLLDSQQKNHEIRMADSKGHDLYVTNLQVAEINSPEELHVCLRTAQQNRAVAATFANERSSRSHSVARIRLIGIHAEKDEQSIGNLNLVDLAGSERLKGEEAARTAETKNINKSLANLGNVILALLKKQDHIPYRNSKLTHLLMPSLGGNSKTLMLLNVSPLDECFNETLNSLRFASNVNSCKTGNIKRSRTVINNTY